MKVTIKSTKKKDLKRFTMGKTYDVIDSWRVMTSKKYPVILDDNGARCMITLTNCNHIKGDWAFTEGSFEDLQS